MMAAPPYLPPPPFLRVDNEGGVCLGGQEMTEMATRYVDVSGYVFEAVPTVTWWARRIGPAAPWQVQRLHFRF